MDNSWTINDSQKLYQILAWGAPYFAINQAGNIIVSPHGNNNKIDLFKLVEELQKQDLSLPLLINFSDILDDRLKRLHDCFAQAISDYGYDNCYRGVYPIKCNQNSHLVEKIVSYGKAYHFGLEVGSKAELMIALATLNIDKTGNTLLICNGYKDEKYIEMALLSQQLGHNIIIIIERINELFIALQLSEKLNLKLHLGIRVKLQSRGSGRWGNSTGEKAKFGLTIPEIIQVIDTLTQEKKLDSLQLLHFHLGSQISSISIIKDAIREASQVYVHLCKLGAKMKYFNVGGGLAVDYDGSKSNSHASKNYHMQHYANDVVAGVKEICDTANIPHPILVSESGRAIVSHHSVLICNVVNHNQPQLDLPTITAHQEPLVIRNLWTTYENINDENYQEMYHDAVQFKEEAISLFNLGYLSLTQRSKAEKIYGGCCYKIYQITHKNSYFNDDLKQLNNSMIATYYLNLSIFQSIPDSWAIEQIFPIVPLHRLKEKPTEKVILADLTCDSDGKIDKFIDLQGENNYLALHKLKQHSENNNQNYLPYYLGFFLVGAYQETLGNLHNLFGKINIVNIEQQDHNYQIKKIVKGDNIADVLNKVKYSAPNLKEKVYDLSKAAIKHNRINYQTSQDLIQNYEHNLSSYTYLTSS